MRGMEARDSTAQAALDRKVQTIRIGADGVPYGLLDYYQQPPEGEKMLRQMVKQFTESLPNDEKSVIYAIYYRGWTEHQTGDMFETPLKVVRRIHNGALYRLRLAVLPTYLRLWGVQWDR